MSDDAGETQGAEIPSNVKTASAHKIARLQKRLNRRTAKLGAVTEALTMARVAALYEAAEVLHSEHPGAARDLKAHIVETDALPEAFCRALEQSGGAKIDE